MAVQALCSIVLWSSVPRGQALEWAEFPGLGPFIPVPLVSKEFPPAISEWCVWKLLGKAGIHTSPCVGQELPGPACTRGGMLYPGSSGLSQKSASMRLC